MGHILKLTKSQAMDVLNDLFQDMSDKTNIPYKAKNDMDINTAKTISDDNDYPIKTEIGISQLDNPKFTDHKQSAALLSKIPGIKQFSHIPDRNFAWIILNTFHEYGHYIQKTQLFRKTEMEQNEQHQLLHEIACMGNVSGIYENDYYKDNYRYNPNEIQAEQYDINAAYQYLSDTFPDTPPENHEQIILDLINHKTHTFTYFVTLSKNDNFKSLNDMNKAFDKAFKNSFQVNNDLNITKYSDSNPLKIFMLTHKEAMGAYTTAKTSFTKTKCLATINLEIRKNKTNPIYFPGLQSLNLNYENDIYKPGKIAIRNPVQRQEDEINMQLGKIPPDDEFLEKQEKQKQQYKLAAQELLLNMLPPSSLNEDGYNIYS